MRYYSNATRNDHDHDHDDDDHDHDHDHDEIHCLIYDESDTYQ
jgi:hypothetical protein